MNKPSWKYGCDCWHVKLTDRRSEAYRIFQEVILPKKQWKTIEWEDLRFLQENWIYQDNLFHARMDMIRDRNDKNLTEEEEIKKK